MTFFPDRFKRFFTPCGVPVGHNRSRIPDDILPFLYS